MIDLQRGNLLEADVEAVVNTVNTEGIMGKGVALQFRKAYPDNYEAYRKACEAGEVRPGQMFVFDRGTLTNPRYIINFPTKRHWRARSRIGDIETGLAALVGEVRRLGVKSIAVPPLGCGLGGLHWPDVHRLMLAAFDQVPEVDWRVYEPSGTPEPELQPNRTQRPRMTRGRATVIALIGRYLVPGFDYSISLLEIQKLAYFLKEAGEPMKLDFVKSHYGPYADVLRHVLVKIDGHFITGYGDGKNTPETPISLMDDAQAEAERCIEDLPETLARMYKVAQLIEGFETPLGMELLATVHWVSAHEGHGEDSESALRAVQSWNTRKAKVMKAEQVDSAWRRLRDLGWLGTTN